MTSKNSYFDLTLIFDKIRKSPWIVTLYSVVLFFSMPVFLAITMQGLTVRTMQNREEYLLQAVSSFFKIDNKFMVFLAILMAVISAATVLFYLTSRKQVDFYHSLPVRREKLFIANYTAGALFYLIPYTVNVILSLLVLGGMGLIQYITLGTLMYGYLINLLLYLVIYTIAVFAMILCGNLVVGIMGTAVFLVFGPVLCVSYVEMLRHFYKNYYEILPVEAIMRNSSPAFDFMVANSFYTFSAVRVIAYIILTVVLVIVSLYLYRRRPSEAAGHAMAFRISRPVIKYPIVFVCTLLAGLFFLSAGGRSTAWMIFGFVCGGVISHFIIEIIYHFDFKAIFKNIKGLVAFAVLFAIFISVPAFDLTGYDKRLPKKEDIKTTRINIINFNQNSYFTSMDAFRPIDYSSRERTVLDRLALSGGDNIDAIFEIARLGAANTGKEGTGYDAAVGIEFELKSGKKIARRYSFLKSSEIEPHIISLFDTPEFKQKFYKLYSIDTVDVSQVIVQDLYARSGMNQSAKITDSSKITSLIGALRTDMLNLKGASMKTETPVILLNLINGDPKVKVQWEIQLPVYPSFTQTMALLNSMDIEKPKMIPLDMVDYIQVYNHEYEKYMYMSYPKDGVVEIPQSVANETRITDKNEIAEILKHIVPDAAVSYDPFVKRDLGYRVNVVSSRYLNGYSESFVFMDGTVPQFIEEKFPMPDNIK